jgi:hypothetical protein
VVVYAEVAEGRPVYEQAGFEAVKTVDFDAQGFGGVGTHRYTVSNPKTNRGYGYANCVVHASETERIVHQPSTVAIYIVIKPNALLDLYVCMSKVNSSKVILDPPPSMSTPGSPGGRSNPEE